MKRPSTTLLLIILFAISTPFHLSAEETKSLAREVPLTLTSPEHESLLESSPLVYTSMEEVKKALPESQWETISNGVDFEKENLLVIVAYSSGKVSYQPTLEGEKLILTKKTEMPTRAIVRMKATFAIPKDKDWEVRHQ